MKPGRTALVTGGAAGIGRACAEALTKAGARVHLVDRDREAVERVAAEIGAIAHIADLSEPDSVENLPAEVDILVNNAGMQFVAPIHEFPPEKFDEMHRLMVLTPFRLMRHCLPSMYERGWGRLIAISSVHGLISSPGKSAYTAAKHALEGLSKAAALEGGPQGVTSNCVNPGYVRTALVENQMRDLARLHGIAEEQVLEEIFLRRPAIKRLIEPEEVAAVVTWLCGDAAGYLTGASIPLDGGWTAT